MMGKDGMVKHTTKSCRAGCEIGRVSMVEVDWAVAELVAAGWFWFVTCCLCASVAEAKNLSWPAWFVAAILCGPLALLALVGMPSRQNQ
jgi:hypothetical protein